MSLRLRRVTLREIRLTLKEPFEISSGSTTDRRILLLELEDVDGVTSWSECVAGERPNFSPETIDTAWLAITEWLAPRLLGGSVPHPSAISEKLGTRIRGHLMARAALEMGGVGGVGGERVVKPVTRHRRDAVGRGHRYLTRHSGITRHSRRQVSRRPEGRISKDQGQDSTRCRHRVHCAGTGRTGTRRSGDGRRQQRVHAARCRPSRRLRRLQSDDDRATACARRPSPSCPAPGPPRHTDLSR